MRVFTVSEMNIRQIEMIVSFGEDEKLQNVIVLYIKC